MSRSRHILKGAVHRHLYALLFTPERQWVRVFQFGRNDSLMVSLDNEPLDNDPLDAEPVDPSPLIVRLVRAVVGELGDNDPMVLIGIDRDRLTLSWPPDKEVAHAQNR